MTSLIAASDGSSPALAAASRFPTRVVARSWSGGALPLGLGEPLELRGGDRLAPDQLPAQLALDWAPEVQEAVIASCLRQAVAGEPWFSMPPAALDGVPGAGRRMVARRIARCAGLPFVAIDVAGPAGASRLRRVSSPPDVVQPSPVVLAMALSRCANPVVLIEGVDDAGHDALGMVKAMVDPVSGRRWSEDALEAVVDLGHVNWLVQSSAALGPPRPLSFLKRLTVPADAEFDHELNRLTLISELVDDLGLDARDVDGAALLAALPVDSKRTNAELRLEAEKELVMMMRPYG